MRISPSSLEVLEQRSEEGSSEEDDLFVSELRDIGRQYDLSLDTLPKIVDFDTLYWLMYHQPMDVHIKIRKEDGEILSMLKKNVGMSVDRRVCFPAEIDTELLIDYREDDDLVYLWDQEKQEEIPLNILYRESILKEDEFVLQKNDTILRIPEYDFIDEHCISWKVLLLFHERDSMLIYPCIISAERGEMKVIQSPVNILEYEHFSMEKGTLLYSTSEIMVYPKKIVWNRISFSPEMFKE